MTPGAPNWYAYCVLFCVVCWSVACICLGMIVAAVLGCFLLSTGSSRPSTQQYDAQEDDVPTLLPGLLDVQEKRQEIAEEA